MYPMTATPIFTTANTVAAYQLRYHFGWYSRGRQPHFGAAPVSAAISEHLPEIAQRHDYRLLESDVNPNVV